MTDDGHPTAAMAAPTRGATIRVIPQQSYCLAIILKGQLENQAAKAEAIRVRHLSTVSSVLTSE